MLSGECLCNCPGFSNPHLKFQHASAELMKQQTSLKGVSPHCLSIIEHMHMHTRLAIKEQKVKCELVGYELSAMAQL